MFTLCGEESNRQAGPVGELTTTHSLIYSSLDTLNFKAKTEEIPTLLEKLRYIRRNVMYNGIFCQ